MFKTYFIDFTSINLLIITLALTNVCYFFPFSTKKKKTNNNNQL